MNCFQGISFSSGQRNSCPVVRETVPYKRIIIYISDAFFASYQKENCNLFYCYEEARRQRSNLIRFPEASARHLNTIARDLKASFQQSDPSTALFEDQIH